MIRWVKSIFAWRVVFVAGCWSYRENAVTGQRSADRVVTGGYSPVDFEWLNDGQPLVPHPLINGLPAWRSAEGRGCTPYFR